MPDPGLPELDVDRFVRLVRVVIENEITATTHHQSVVVTLRPNDLASRDLVSVRFDGVQDLRLQGASAGDLCRLAVEDLSDRGWDRLRYQVSDVDGECISLYAEAILVEEPEASR